LSRNGQCDEPWHGFWPADIPRSIFYAAVPLQGILQKAAISYPARAAIVYLENEISYSQLEAVSNKFADVLANLGVKKGDRVAVFLPSIPQFVIAYFGALKAGAVVTEINPLHLEREVQYQLSDSGAETIVVLDSLFGVVDHVWAKTNLKNVIVTGLDASEKVNVPSKLNVWSFHQLTEEASEATLQVGINPQEDIAVLQYTGGTTGTPKGAMLTHRNLLSMH